jgi:hypothetical protein
MSDDPISNMRGRVEQCRCLARSILDDRPSKVLLKTAFEIEADIVRLEAGRRPSANRPEPSNAA